MAIVRLNINGKEIQTTDDKTILQAALDNGIEIPHLCFDDRIEAYGGCGMCVVELEGSPKLIRSCATKANNGMVIQTNTKRTIATRKTALDMLVSDHRGDCRAPCMMECPAHTDVQGYVGLIANGQYRESLELIKEQLPLPASIGRVCPHPCETACRRGIVDESISVAALKTFVADLDLFESDKGPYMPKMKKDTGKKVAVVGAGPAGLTAAYFLRTQGHNVEIFEAMDKPGGMLRYGIPEYRLPKEVVDKEVEIIQNMGVKINYSMKLGQEISVDYLKNSFDVSFLAIGAWESTSLRCKGEDLIGVEGGIDFLRKVTNNEEVILGEKVVVVGGGNTAMDVARTCIRLGVKEVRVLYRRTEEQMPAEKIEIHEAKEEGVIFDFLVSPIEIIEENGKAARVKCQKMKLGEPDASGRRRPEPIEGEIKNYETDTVIAAIGQRVTLGNIQGIDTTKWGTIDVDEATYQTNIDGIFAGGDVVSGPGIAIAAVAQGKNASKVINSYLQGNIIPHKEPIIVEQNDITIEDYPHIEKQARVQNVIVDPQVRKTNFQSVMENLTDGDALCESSRCLECGCKDYFECQLLHNIEVYDIDTKKEYGEKHKRYEKDDHPYIERNSDKCIQCGLCIRTCDEVMGITALGLIDRGFEAIVAPEFGNSLCDTDCISCGQCIDVCPTGALMEKLTDAKEIPLDLEVTESVCSHCSLGCNIKYHHKGDRIYRVTPDRSKDDGILCVKGKFEFDYINNSNRVLSPMIKNKNQFNAVKWMDAKIDFITKLKSSRYLNGKDSIAFIVSQKLTNEEYSIIKNISKALNTEMIGTMNINNESGMEDMLGENSLEELYNTDLIVAVGKVYENFTPLGVKVKSFNKKLISVSEGSSKLNEFADEAYDVDKQLGFLKEIAKGLIDLDLVDKNYMRPNSLDFEEMKKLLNDIVPSQEALEFAKTYGNAKRAIFLVDDISITKESLKMIYYITSLTGKIQKPYRGIITLKKYCNTQGALNAGFNKSGEEIFDKIKNESIKTLVVIGENILEDNPELSDKLDNLDYLAVIDMFMTETAKKADVVLPLVSLAESEGTLTRTDKKLLTINKVLSPKSGKTNIELFNELLF